MDLLQQLNDAFHDCDDLTVRSYADGEVTLYYFDRLLDGRQFQQIVTSFFEDNPTDVSIMRMLSTWQAVNEPSPAASERCFITSVLEGQIGAVYRSKLYTVASGGAPTRPVGVTERETLITGPHDAFIEDACTNIALLRQRLRTTHLKVKQIDIGHNCTQYVYLIYLEGKVDKSALEEINRRLQFLQIDEVMDGNTVAKYLENSPYSFFPQWYDTERPDAIASCLSLGKIALITDNSPSVMAAPARFLEFFASTGDAYERWHFSVFIRFLRLAAFMLSIMFSAFYVAVTTYHYQFIPATLLKTIVSSRSSVPFDPMIEALLMEFVIELLREAGVRLPTKIGQTIGIVGGLVIGQAVVQAGLAGNVLIVSVAAGALSSFIVPNYTMETSLRLLRFVAILLAGFLGYFGLMVFSIVFIVHLCHLRSINREYICLNGVPFYMFLTRSLMPQSVAHPATDVVAGDGNKHEMKSEVQPCHHHAKPGE
ncbi:spore germination protein [Paenibacillus alvei]|uniref:GerA spore germination protein n=1 Tax=Paenibacillus alvei TaxID=44250 RepID=A0A383RDU7_PAEAL|nr:spore germination protein [Paenibacillus alvei]SYX85265.1 GerA spore germination protein [Paenibacillus alvei]